MQIFTSIVVIVLFAIIVVMYRRYAKEKREAERLKIVLQDRFREQKQEEEKGEFERVNE